MFNTHEREREEKNPIASYSDNPFHFNYADVCHTDEGSWMAADIFRQRVI